MATRENANKISHKWALTYNGELTFMGAYVKYEDVLKKRWKAESTQANVSGNVNLIVKNLYNHDHRAIGSYTLEDFEAAVNKIAKKGKSRTGEKFEPYDDETLERFRYVIQKIVEIAACYGECINVFDAPPAKNRNRTKMKKSIPPVTRSLTAEQEVLSASKLMRHKQSGTNMALFMLYSKGLRNCEAAAAIFGDIRPMENHPGCYELYVYKTSVRNKRTVKGSGKTHNANRIIPLTSTEHAFLMKRKEFIIEKLKNMGYEDAESMIDDLPICCISNDNPTGRISSNDISIAGHKFFQEIKIDENLLVKMKEEMDEAIRQDEEEDPIEPSLTSYVFRRNMATHLNFMDMPMTWVSYYMGHDIQDPYEKRSEFRYEEKRYAIKNYLELRPFLGEIRLDETTEVTAGKCIRITRNGKFSVPADVEAVQITLETNEPNDYIKVLISLSSKAIAIEEKMGKAYDDKQESYDKEIDILKQYHAYYRNAEERIRKLMTENNQKSTPEDLCPQ